MPARESFPFHKLFALTFGPPPVSGQPLTIAMTSFEIPGVKLGHFLTVLDSGYRRNPYHNSIHAADVMHSAFYFIHQKISFDSGRFAGRRFKSGRDVY